MGRNRAQHNVGRKSLASGFALSLVFAGFAAHSQSPSPPATPKETFTALLGEYKRFPPEITKKAGNIDLKSFEGLDPKLLDNLSPGVLKSRYELYNPKYLTLSRIEKKLEKEVKSLGTRLDNTPLSSFKERSDVELKFAALKAQYDKVRFTLFITSINANSSVTEAIQTLPADKRVLAKAAPARPPRLPGVYQGSAIDRKKQVDADKAFLTPVDPEFYTTALGRKLEKDLGGRADYWSYDYESDGLYVSVGQELGKVTVFQDPGGVRYIRTRAGSSFTETRNGDQKIDLANAQGRFLTGDKTQETLFGRRASGPGLSDETPSGRGGGGEDHDHHDN